MTKLPTTHVLCIGDADTLADTEPLRQHAQEFGFEVEGFTTWEHGAAYANQKLAELPALVSAVTQATAHGLHVWLPNPLDLNGMLHIDLVSELLRWRGCDLLLGPHLVNARLHPRDPMQTIIQAWGQDLLEFTSAMTASQAVSHLLDEIIAVGDSGTATDPTMSTADGNG
jgi:hypothetical protein